MRPIYKIIYKMRPVYHSHHIPLYTIYALLNTKILEILEILEILQYLGIR